MSERKQRYAINMKNGMVVACTSETLPSAESFGNIHFKEIDITVARAIRDGKITKEEVIRQIQEKVGVPSYSDMMEAMKHLNVREKDIGLESAVKGEVVAGAAAPVEITIPGAAEPEKPKAAEPKKPKAAHKPAEPVQEVPAAVGGTADMPSAEGAGTTVNF